MCPLPSPVDDLHPAAPGERRRLATAFLQTLDKLMRGMRLYEGEGPLVKKLLGLAATSAEALLTTGPITLRVAPFGLVLDGARVTDDEDQLSKALFRFFGDGIRELTLQPGIEPAELLGLAAVLRTEPKAGEDDMTTLLWKQEFTHISFYATDTFQATTAVHDTDSFALGGSGSDRGPSQSGQGSHQTVLSPDDLRLLKDDETLSWMRRCEAPLSPPRSLQPTIERVLADFARPPDQAAVLRLAVAHQIATGGEPSALLIAAFDAFLAEGDTDAIVAMVEAVGEAGDAALGLRCALLSPDRLLRIAPLYERDFALLSPCLEDAGGHGDASLVPLLNALPHGPAEERLRSGLEKGDVELSSFYARQMGSNDPDVVVGAIGALADSQSPEAYEAISRALGATLTKVRHAALEAMKGRYAPEARPALERALRDPDRDNRLLALRILEDSGDPPVARSILAMAQDLGGGDDEELRAAFRALSHFRNPRIIEYLSDVLADRNLTRSRVTQTRQLLAVNALREIGTTDAVARLQASGGSWHLSRPVKDAIGTALRRRPEAP